MLPHSGPNFDLGQKASLLVELENLSKFEACPREIKKVPELDNHRFRRSISQFDFAKFNDFEQISTYLESFDETEVVGVSHEARNIYSVKLGNSRKCSNFL